MACLGVGCSREDCNHSAELTVAVVERAVDRHHYRDNPFFYLSHISFLRDARNDREIYMIESRGGTATVDYAGMFPFSFSFSVCIFPLYT